MKTFIVFFISLLHLLVASSQFNQFPQIYYNAYNGFLPISSTKSFNGSQIDQLYNSWQIGVTDAEVLNDQNGISMWAKVCLPSTDGYVRYGYVLYGSSNIRISEINTYATVNVNNLFVRPCPGCTGSNVKLYGQNAYFGQNSIVALTGNSSGVWYEVYLPYNCSQATGWLSSQSGYLTINNNISDYFNIAGSVTSNSDPYIKGALIDLGIGSTYSTFGFYQYKWPKFKTDYITCDHPDYSTSNPPNYYYTANGHNYSLDFVLSNSPSTCVQWVPSPPSDPNVIDATEYLCSVWPGIIEETQNSNSLNSLLLQELAYYVNNGVFLLGGNSPSDYYPTPFVDVSTLSNNAPYYYQDAVKTLLYLDYDDGTPCLSRDYFFVGGAEKINKGRAIRAIMEAFKSTVSTFDYIGYNPLDNSSSDFLCDIYRNDRFYPWIKKAFYLGYLNGLIQSCGGCGAGNCFKNSDPNLNKGEFFILIANVIKNIGIPSPTQNDFFIPNNIKSNNSNNSLSLDKGVFNSYEKDVFNIPGGGMSLDFSFSYHSNLTEIPFLSNTYYDYNYYLQKIFPLGKGWTHNYNIYVQAISKDGSLNSPDQKLLVVWADGTYDMFDYINKSYESKSVKDVLTIEAYDQTNGTSNATKISIRKPDGTVYRFSRIIGLHPSFWLDEIVDRNNNKITLNYVCQSSNNFFSCHLSTISDSYSKRNLKFNYQNNTNFIQSVEDVSGQRVILFNVDPATNNLVTFIDPKGLSTNYQYGNNPKEANLLKRIILPKGNIIDNTYFNRKIKSSSNNQYNINVDWNSNYLNGWTSSTVMTSINGQQFETRFEHNERGNPSKIITPTGNALDFEYNDSNNPDKPTLIRDNSKNLEYKFNQFDPFGNPKVKVKSNSTWSQTETFEYNGFSQITSYADAKGNKTKYGYSTTGDLLTIEQPNNIITQYSYDSYGNPTSMTNPSGIITDYGYNNFGNLNSIQIHNTAIKSSAKYDNSSRVTSVNDPKGVVTSYDYDQNDNITNEVEDLGGLNLQTQHQYDQNDNLRYIYDPRGLQTELQYDYSTDDLIAERHGGLQKNWTYNSDGSLKTFNNKNGTQFNYQYGQANTPSAAKVIDDGYATYSYSTRQELSQVSRNGKTIIYAYDDMNRIERILYNDPPSTVAYEYDLNDNISRIKYSYNSSKFIDYKYDALNRLTSVLDWNGNYLVQYDYLNDGRLNSETLGNGVATKYFYDNAGRLDSIITKKSNGEVLIAVKATLDLNSNHTSESIYMKLIGNSYFNHTAQFSSGYYYSSNDNRLQSVSGYGFNNYQYTNNGAIRDIQGQDGHISMTWDERDKLLNYTNFDSAKNYTYEYDPYGNRRRFNNTRYVLDILNGGNVLFETDLNGASKSMYVYGLGLICRIDPNTNEVSYYHYDFRGSTLGITNASQNFTHQYQYDGFGNIENKYFNGFSNPFEFVGKHGIMYDETGYSYMRARYYDPKNGRFLSEDPIWGNNLYDYAGDNPIVNIDPDGEFLQFIVGAAIGVGVGYITSKLTGSNYTWQNAATDAIIGAFTPAAIKGIGKFASLALKESAPLLRGGKTFLQYKFANGGTETLAHIRTSSGIQRISTEFHHAFIRQSTQKAYNLPNWLVNNKINVWKLNTIQHSILDVNRRQFLRSAIKSDVGIFGKYNWFTKF